MNQNVKQKLRVGFLTVPFKDLFTITKYHKDLPLDFTFKVLQSPHIVQLIINTLTRDHGIHWCYLQYRLSSLSKMSNTFLWSDSNDVLCLLLPPVLISSNYQILWVIFHYRLDPFTLRSVLQNHGSSWNFDCVFCYSSNTINKTFLFDFQEACL